MARRKSNKPRTRRDRRTLRPLDRGVKDPTLLGQIQVVVSGLVKPFRGSNMAHFLPAILKATKNNKEAFLKRVLAAFMVIREPALERMIIDDEEPFTRAKEILAEHIEQYWGVKIEPSQLEQTPHPWENYEDLNLGYDPEKLPKVRKVRKPKQKEVDIEEPLEDDGASGQEVENKQHADAEDALLQEEPEENLDDYEEMDESELESLFDSDEFDEYD